MNMATTFRNFQRDGTLDRFESAVARNLLPGLRLDDPMVKALIKCASLLNWMSPQVDIFQAMPHFPSVFTLDDLRNAFHNMGVPTSLAPATRRQISNISGPALIIDPSGYPYLLESPEDTSVSDPVTGKPRGALVKRGDLLLTFHQSDALQTDTSPWSSKRLRAMRGDVVKLVTIKLMITILSVAAAFGIVGMYSVVIPTQAMDSLLAIGIGLMIAMAGDFAFRNLRASISARVAARSDYVAATNVIGKILSLPMERLGQSGVAAQAARAKQLAATPRTVFGTVLEILIDIPIAAVLLAGLFLWSWQLAMIPLAVCMFCVTLAWVAYPAARKRTTTARKTRAQLNSAAHELCHGLHQIYANGEESEWLEKMARAGRANARAHQSAAVLQRSLDAIASAAIPIAGGLIAIVGAVLVMNGNITSGALLAVMVMSWRVLAPIRSAYQILARAADFRNQMSQIDALMDLPATKGPVNETHNFQINGSVELRKVVCRYPGSTVNALNGVSLRIPEGSFVTLTGSSGSGKSTLLRCVAGLYPPRAGQVLIGGLNSAQIPSGALHELISYVPEVPAFIHGTVAQNLRIAQPWADDRMLLDLCETFGLGSFINDLPDGIHTRLTTARQTSISQGQGQALATVRAVLNNPRILLLDDPAGSMDAYLETALMTWIAKHRSETTVLMATHRPSHVRASDYEVQLRSGNIVSFHQTERQN